MEGNGMGFGSVTKWMDGGMIKGGGKLSAMRA